MATRLHPIRDERGNVAVEFALVLPFFLLLLMGLVDYGLAAREKSRLESAARAGLQAVLTAPEDTSGALAAAEAVAGDAEIDVATACLCADGTEVACSDTCTVGNRRQVVTVSVSTDHSLLVPWPGLDDPLPLSATARVRVR